MSQMTWLETPPGLSGGSSRSEGVGTQGQTGLRPGMRFNCLLVRTGEQVQAGAVLAGGMGSPWKNRGNPYRHLRGRGEGKNKCIRGLGRQGKRPAFVLGA